MDAILTVRGMFEYANDIFDDMVLPQAGTVTATDGTVINYPAIDKELVMADIFMSTMSFSVILTNPIVLKFAIGAWSKTCLPKWERLYKTMFYAYQPLENYDRLEVGKDVRTPDLTRGINHDSKTISTGMSDTTGNIENKTSAFNSPTYSPLNYGDTKEHTEDVSSGTTNRTEQEKETGTDTTDHNLRAHGNIGVTSSQQMLMQEREVADFNIYHIISQDFADQFCIQLY